MFLSGDNNINRCVDSNVAEGDLGVNSCNLRIASRKLETLFVLPKDCLAILATFLDSVYRLSLPYRSSNKDWSLLSIHPT